MCLLKLGTANRASLTEFSPIFWFLYSSGTAADLCLLSPAVCKRGYKVISGFAQRLFYSCHLLVMRQSVIVAQSLSEAKCVLGLTAH